MAYDDELDTGSLGELGNTLAPIMTTSGADWEQAIASGNPQRYLSTLRTGQPAGSAAQQPQPYMPADMRTNIPAAVARAAANPQLPASNAPNPLSEATSNPAVPGTITPSGTAKAPVSRFASAAPSPDVNGMESQLVQASAPQSATNPNGVPNVKDPTHPEYRPSIGRRIIRGLVAGGEGLAEGGFRGALLGALDPEKVGATAYGAGTSRFNQAARQNQMAQQSLQQQLEQAATNAKTAEEQAKASGEQLVTVGDDEADSLGIPAGTQMRQQDVQRLRVERTKANAKSQANDVTAAKAGLKKDEDGNWIDDPNSEAFKARQVMTDLRTAQTASAEAQEELRRAQAAGMDPNSPQFKLKVQQAETARENAAAAGTRAQGYLLNATSGAFGTDTEGNALPGAMITDNGQPVGSRFQSNVRPTGQQRRTANLAQSADQQLNDMKSIVQSRPDIFGPAAGRTTDFTNWIGSQDPDAQRFRAARTIAGDHLAGVFGGRSEAALNALDTAIGHYKDNPKAILAGLDQLSEANNAFIKAGTYKTVGGKNAPAGNAPREGATKTNSSGDKVVYRNGKWGPA